MIDFLIKSSVCLFLLLSIYKLFLEHEKMSVFNRFYLLGSLTFSMLIPFISFEIQIETIKTVNLNAIEIFQSSPVIVTEKTNYLPILLWSSYGIITSIFAFRFCRNSYSFFQKIQSNPTQKFENATLVLVEEKILPHTFLNYIFINKDDYENRKIEGELFTHELTHVHQKHTLDVLFIEVLKTVFWFNPLLIFYKKAIQLNHEFLADEKVVTSYKNVPFYQSLLLEKASWNSNFYLASNLNFLVTKKRLIMMTKTASAKIILLKKIALLPVLTGLIYFLCVETVAQQKNESPKTQTTHTKLSENKWDEYFAGVRIKVYRNTNTATNKVVRENLILDKLYEDLTSKEKDKYKMWLYVPQPLAKKSPAKKELEEYQNSKKYAIWIDGENVANSELGKYKPEGIAYFSGSVILKNARTKKHPQPFQFWFYTHSYFEKEGMGKEKKRYGGDEIEIFEKIGSEKVNSTKQEIAKPENTQPEFQGGQEAFYKFIVENFKMPKDFKGEGNVVAKIIIEIDGSVTNIEIIKDLGFGTGEEVKRVLSISPKWKAGMLDGKPARSEFKLPIKIVSK